MASINPGLGRAPASESRFALTITITRIALLLEVGRTLRLASSLGRRSRRGADKIGKMSRSSTGGGSRPAPMARGLRGRPFVITFRAHDGADAHLPPADRPLGSVLLAAGHAGDRRPGAGPALG